ncbi:NB-ARC - like 10 [Theobroma cacao]|nr:NB-ARC - like 10 [Theobroma cacao]
MDAEVVVSLLSQKLQNLLHDEEIAMTPKVRDQVQRTTHQLNLIRQLLKEADQKSRALTVEMNSRKWTTRLLGALYSLDDAIDNFLVRKALQSRKPFTSFCNGVVFKKEMKLFISRTGDLIKNKQPLDIQDVTDNNIPGPSQHQRWARISDFCFDGESHVVGLEEQVKNLVALVVQGAEQGNQPAVVSMVGEGGSGKTAIARIVYNRVDIKRHFTSRAWVHVTKEFKVRDVLVDMITQLDEKIAKEPLLEDELKWRLPKLLGQGRYLIVVDDVDAPEFWEAIKEVFPPSSHGGVVIVTTRKAGLAVPAGSTLQKLQNLLHDEEIAMTPKVKDQVQRTTHQLNLIRQLLKEADQKSRALTVEINSRKWTTRLLRALYSLDDAIDNFLVRKALQSRKPFTSFCNGVVFKKEMKLFISRTGDLIKNKQPLDIQDVTDNNIPGPSQHQRWARISDFCFDGESHVVGLEEQVKNLVALVVQGAEQGNQPAVVSMVGEGGSGKTAIARIVYNRVDIKRHFTSRAWVHVTKEFKVRDVLVDMITQLDEKIAKEPLLEDELKWRLPKLLGQGRYLIVVDDVDAPEFWEAIKEVFPPSSHGGVVIVTTRKAGLAVPAGSTLQAKLARDILPPKEHLCPQGPYLEISTEVPEGPLK